MGSIADLYASVRADMSQFDSDLAKGLTKSGDRAGKTLGSSISASLKRHSTLIAAGIGAGIGDFATSGVQAFTQLDTKMREVFTLMPGITDQAMAEMTQSARDFAVQFGISTDEAIGGLYNSLSAGVPPENVFAFMETAQKAATAGVTDLSSSIGLLTAVTKGYGDTSQEFTQRTADLAFTTVKLGQTTFPELAASIGEVVPGASALGVSVEELNAVFATLTGVTGNASKVSTQYKAVQTALMAQNPVMTAALKEMGFETSAAALASLGLQDTLKGLVATTGGSQQQMQKMFGSVEALTAVLPLTGAASQKFTSNLDEMGDTAGAVDDAFTTMDSGLEASGRKIAAFFNDVKLTVGKELQALGPLFYAFGPQMGRWIGRGLGAAGGLIAAQLSAGISTAVAAMGVPGSVLIAKASALGQLVGTRFTLGVVAGVVALPLILQEAMKAADLFAGTGPGDLMKSVNAESLDLLARAKRMKSDIESERLALANELNARYGEQGEEVDALRARFDALNAAGRVLHSGTREQIAYLVANGIEAYQAWAGAMAGVEEVAGDLEGDVGDLSATLGETTDEMQELAPAVDATAVRFGELRQAMKAADKEWQRLLKNPDQNSKSLKALNQDIKDWETRYLNALKRGDEAQSEFALSQLKAAVADRKARREASVAAKQQKADIKTVAETLNVSMRAAARLYLKHGQDLDKTLGKAQALDEVDPTVTVNVTGESSLDRVVTKIRGLTSGEAVVRIDGQVFGGIGGRASGGPVYAHTPYVVGERGPEVIIPRTSGTVIANDRIGGDTYEIAPQIYGLPMQAQTPLEVVQQLRRAVRMGMVAPRKSERRFST